MLQAIQITKKYGAETVLDRVNLVIQPGERWGLVGANGCGKTTLLRILVGEVLPDGGNVVFRPSNVRIGYLPQGMRFAGEETLDDFLTRMGCNLERTSAALAEIAEQMAFGGKVEQVYDQLLEQLTWAAQGASRASEVLAALGLDALDRSLPCATLSGGQKTRLSLAAVLLSSPQLLLLDEPTNHLDIEMIEWLENWLGNASQAALIVSHDRAFLDRVVDGIFELDGKTHELRAYVGNYSTYLEAKIAEREEQRQRYQDQQQEIERLRGSIGRVRGAANFRKGGKADSGDKFAKGFFANRSLETMRRARALERRLERLLQEDALEKPHPDWQMRVEFADAPVSGRDVLVLQDLAVGYDERPLLTHLNATLRFGQRVALIGPNGCGKTTLLRTIVGQVPALEGQFRLGSKVQLGYMAQEQEDLPIAHSALTAVLELGRFSETEARSFLSKFLFKGDDVFTPIGSLSYGERSRLRLALLAASGCNLLLLDEPINHLDIPARTRFEQALTGFEGSILAVVHDRYFIAGFATVIWEVKEGQLRVQSLS